MIIRVTGQNLSQRAFSRAIWAHQRVAPRPVEREESVPGRSPDRR